MTKASNQRSADLRPLRCRSTLTDRLAVPALIVCAPLAAWWLVGLNHESEGGRGHVPPGGADQYDYMVQPPPLNATVEWTVGAGALVALVIAAAVLITALRSGQFDRRWLSPIVSTCAAGCIVGAAARIVTAPVIGANIGGGISILFGTPVVAALLVWSLARSVHILRTTAVSAA